MEHQRSLGFTVGAIVRCPSGTRDKSADGVEGIVRSICSLFILSKGGFDDSELPSILDEVEKRGDAGDPKALAQDMDMDAITHTVPCIVMDDHIVGYFDECVRMARQSSIIVRSYALCRTMTMVFAPAFFIVAIVVFPSPINYAPDYVHEILEKDTSNAKYLTGALQYFEIDPVGIALLTVLNTVLTAGAASRANALSDSMHPVVQFNVWKILLEGFIWGIAFCGCAVTVYFIVVYLLLETHFGGDFLGLGIPLEGSGDEHIEDEYTWTIGRLSITMWSVLSSLCLGSFCMTISRDMFLVDVCKRFADVYRDALAGFYKLLPIFLFLGGIAWSWVWPIDWPFHGSENFFNNPSTALKFRTAGIAVGTTLLYCCVIDLLKFIVWRCQQRPTHKE